MASLGCNELTLCRLYCFEKTWKCLNLHFLSLLDTDIIMAMVLEISPHGRQGINTQKDEQTRPFQCSLHWDINQIKRKVKKQSSQQFFCGFFFFKVFNETHINLRSNIILHIILSPKVINFKWNRLPITFTNETKASDFIWQFSEACLLSTPDQNSYRLAAR